MFQLFKKSTHSGDTEPTRFKYNRIEKDVNVLLGDRKSEIESLQQTTWGYVAISQEQFNQHYSTLLKRAAMYSQDTKAIHEGIQNASRALAGTMINRLPYDRPREDGHQVEQLWKYTMFACHIIRRISEEPRTFYDSDERILTGMSDKAVQWSATENGINTRWILINSLPYLFDEVSLQWLGQDSGRALHQVLCSLHGEPCFIDEQQSATSTQTAIADRQQEDPGPKPIPENNGDFDNASETVKGLSDEEAMKVAISLKEWALANNYLQEGGIFIPGLDAIKKFTDDTAWTGTVREIQDCMTESGWGRKTRGKGRSKINGYYLVNEG